jgi:hypothetical protein
LTIEYNLSSLSNFEDGAFDLASYGEADRLPFAASAEVLSVKRPEASGEGTGRIERV